jgi:hypothetical protein
LRNGMFENVNLQDKGKLLRYLSVFYLQQNVNDVTYKNITTVW